MPAKKSAPAAAPANLFAGAAVLPTKPTAKAKEADKAGIALPEVERLCHYDAIQKAAEAACAAIKAELKEVAVDHFLGCGSEKWPENTKARENAAQLGVQFRRKAVNIALSEGEVAILREVGVEPHEEVTVQDLFALNPDYLADSKWQQAITQALLSIPGLPGDMIVRQQKVSKFVVTEHIADQVWKSGDAEAIGVVSGITFVPKLDSLDQDTMAVYVRELFQLGEDKAPAPTVKAVVEAAAARATVAGQKSKARAEGARKARAEKVTAK